VKNKLLGLSLIVMMILGIPFVAVAKSTQSPKNAVPVPITAEQEKINMENDVFEKVLSGKYIVDVNTGVIIPNPASGGVITPDFASPGYEISHQWLGVRAVRVLEYDGKSVVANKISSNAGSFLAGCDWPDLYENYPVASIPTYLGHFGIYTNYLPTNNSSPTALTRFNYWIGQASTYYDKNASDNSYAILCLGIAYHYFSDLNAPHHAGNVQAIGSNHLAWETWADENKESFVATSASLWYDRFGWNFNNYAVDSGNRALTWLTNATQYPIGSDACFDSAYYTYTACQQNGAAMLNAFFQSEGVS